MDSTVTAEQIRWFRLRRSGLVRPFQSPAAAASALVGVQAQILPAAGLALWNRTEGLTHQRFEALLYDERTLLKLWAQRHTLHLFPSEEWPLVQAALAQQQTWWERRVEQEGGDVSAYRELLQAVETLLREQGTLGRSDLRASDLPVEAWHLSSWGGLFADLVRRGYACHAGQRGNEGRFAHRTYWLPDLEWNPPDPDAANIEIARRYFRTYGPARAHDLAYWRGLSLVTPIKRWVQAMGEELMTVQAGGQSQMALREDAGALFEAPPEREAWPVRLLYRFDPLLLGSKDKSWIIADEHKPHVWRPAGHIEGVILEHGRVCGTWRYDRKGSGLVITLRPFAPLPDHVRRAVEQHAAGVAEFFGLPLSELRTEPLAD